MKVVVLLSAGRHPVSGRAVLPDLEARAIALATHLDPHCRGVHAGSAEEGVHEAFGYGLPSLDLLAVEEGSDPVPALVSYLSDIGPDLILAGRRGQGGKDTGLVPYALADELHLPLLSDIVSVQENGAVAQFEQVLSKGAKRRVTVRLPAIATVHPLAPPAMPFAYAKARRGRIERHEVLSVPENPSHFEQRPHRFRPKLMRQADATEGAADSVIVDPDPDKAARMIVDHIEALGVRRFRADHTQARD